MRVISTNKTAMSKYNIEQELECSIILYKDEVIEIIDNGVCIDNEHFIVDDQGVYTVFTINNTAYPTRIKTILCTKNERQEIQELLKQPNTVVFPVKLYEHNNVIKLTLGIGICKGI